jgi:hypothetical protein
MVNFYSDKTIKNIRATLVKIGGPIDDVPFDIFRMTLMIQFGMTKGTADKWIKNYEYAKVIQVDKKGDDWVVNFI